MASVQRRRVLVSGGMVDIRIEANLFDLPTPQAKAVWRLVDAWLDFKRAIAESRQSEKGEGGA